MYLVVVATSNWLMSLGIIALLADSVFDQNRFSCIMLLLYHTRGREF